VRIELLGRAWRAQVRIEHVGAVEGRCRLDLRQLHRQARPGAEVAGDLTRFGAPAATAVAAIAVIGPSARPPPERRPGARHVHQRRR
jgi:hypothetical protein